MSTTHPVDTYVRIRDLDPERRATHAADAIVCRADRLADALLESGWFAVLPDLIAPELQRALLAGRCTDGMERSLDIEIEKLSEGNATLPSMNTTTHLHLVESTPTWRDLADQLSASDIAHLERVESNPGTTATPFGLRVDAERMVRRAQLAAAFADVPPPADARDVGFWEDNDEDGPERHFWGTDRDANGIGVQIHGFQQADGRVSARHISVDCNMGDLDAATARAVGSAFLAAADELDQLQVAR